MSGSSRRAAAGSTGRPRRAPSVARGLGALFAVAAFSAGPAATAQAQSPDPRSDPTRYCDERPLPGSLGAATDAEHSIKLGDPPLRPGMRRRRITVGGVSTVVTEAGRPGDDEVVVFAHGSPNHGREWDRLLSAAGRHGRAIAFDFPGFGNADTRSAATTRSPAPRGSTAG